MRPAPATLRQEVAAELRVAVRPPFEIPRIVVVNTAILLAGWFLLGPQSVTNTSAAIFLPFAVAVWAFADVPATNVLGANAPGALAALGHPARIRRMFTVRDLTLLALICPACIGLSLVLLPGQDRPYTSIAVIMAVIALPLGFLGLASVSGVLLPYHPMSLRQRVRRPATWPRWLGALMSPLLIALPAAVITLLVPALLLRVLILGQQPQRPVFNPDYVLGVSSLAGLGSAAASVLWSVAVWRGGLLLASWVAVARGSYLRAFLSDPGRG